MNRHFFEDLSLIKKDEQQSEAFESSVNTVVIAGPGSGKTRVLALKAVALARSIIQKPAGLALISYSRETVRELKKRVKLYGYRESPRDFIGTVHSFSLLHVIEPFGHLYPEYGIKYPIKILPSDIELNIYNSVLKEINATDRQAPLIQINRHRSLSQPGTSAIKIDSTDIIARAAAIFEKKLFETNFLDFNALINLSAKIIHEQEFVRHNLKSRFPWLLIDEYQDLGKCLHEMVLELTLNAGVNLFAVGDMNQSIYGFTGGYPQFLEELTEFDDIKTIQLSSNYRSNQHIITASLQTLEAKPPEPVYVAKFRQDELPNFTFITCSQEMAPQYQIVADKIIPKLISEGTSLNEIGIIVGSNDQVRSMALHLSRKSMPFYISKWRFENSSTVAWLQDCARFCVDPTSQSFDELFKFWRSLLQNHNDERRNNEAITEKVNFYRILTESRAKETLDEWLQHLIGRLEIADLLKDSEMYPNEIENLSIVIDEAKNQNLKGASLLRFANLGKPNDEITISTRHSSKGLEFEVVIMLGMEEEKFPSWYDLQSPLSIAEAQRLCYVCVSRAKKSCILLRSVSYPLPWGDYKKHPPSRFWTTIHKKFGTNENSFMEKDFQ
jgi:DNA helicase-2/ATP-dependent DNA helicase PcrA